MPLPNDPDSKLIDTDACLLEVSKMMRGLAEELAKFANASEPTKLRAISSELATLGWNSLFVSTILEDIVEDSARWSEIPSDTKLQLISTQVDILCTAVGYLEKSIFQLKTRSGHLLSAQPDGEVKRLRDLGNRLLGVGNGCR